MTITDGERYAKASGVDERLGRFRLEERFGERLTGRTDGEQQVDRTPPPSPPTRKEPLEKVRGALSGNGATKGDASIPGERAAGDAAGRSSVYESLFGKPALERGEATRGGGSGQLLGAAAVAARPVSSEDGEVAQARGIPDTQVEALIEEQVFYPSGIPSGGRIVNVLALNLALDQLQVLPGP